MKDKFINEFKNHEIVIEYLELMQKLETKCEIINLVKLQKELHESLNLLDKYSSEYSNVYGQYKLASSKLLSNEEYARFKELERELNLFVMKFNKQLKEVFDLEKKGCKH